MKKAIVLLSGGLDSTTALYVARQEAYQVICLSFNYGQLHDRELESAKKITGALKLEHWIVPLSLPWGGSAITDSNVPLPKSRSNEEMKQGIPSTYVPARNSIFLSLAASLAEAKEAEAIYFGANALDYSGYPDCRPAFIETFQELIERGTKAGSEGKKIKIVAPLLQLSKSEIVQLGKKLGIPFEWTWSCYEGKEVPCGECDSCILRAKGFREAEADDPLLTKPSLRGTGREATGTETISDR